MTRKGKSTLYIAGGIIGLLLLLFVIKFISSKPYTSRLPILEDTQVLSQAVKDQIAEARVRAKRNPSADNLGMLAMVYHSSATYTQAAVCYKLAIEKEKSEWIWNYYLGYLHTEMGDSEAAIENFNQVLASNPDVHHARYYLGEELKNLQEYEQAEKSLSAIISIKKNSSVGKENTRTDHFPLGNYARFQLSRIYFDSGQADRAEKTLIEILETSRSFGPAYRLLGNIYGLQGDLILSEKYGVRANELMELSPPIDTLIDRLALLSKSELYLPKKIDEAINAVYPHWALTLINQALTYFPDDKYIIAKAINTNLWVQRNDQAFSYLDQHMSGFQNDFAELNHMGLLLYEKELYAQSIGYWTRTLLLKPGDLEIQKRLAISYWKVGEKQKSQNMFEEILKNNPEDFEVLAEVADILFFELEERQKALGYLVLLDHFSRSNPKVQKMSAWMAQANGEYTESISLYESPFKGDPEDFTTIKNLGALYMSQKMWSKSIQLYREALVYHPNEPYYLERLGTLLVNCPDASLRNYKEGSYYSERAFTHSTDNTMIIIAAGRSLAIASAMLGKKQYAFLVLNSTIEIAQKRNVPQQNLAVLLDLSKELQ